MLEAILVVVQLAAVGLLVWGAVLVLARRG